MTEDEFKLARTRILSLAHYLGTIDISGFINTADTPGRPELQSEVALARILQTAKTAIEQLYAEPTKPTDT